MPKNNFQYPPSDRAHCNRAPASTSTPHRRTFSILHRIEPTVTPPGVLAGSWLSSFQYPPSDRAHCNGAIDGRAETAFAHFQYPPSDRAHCNPARLERTGARHSNFQYPPSDRAHCNTYPPRASCTSRMPFSILHRIEPTVTLLAVVASRPGTALSVSSIGSSPL